MKNPLLLSLLLTAILACRKKPEHLTTARLNNTYSIGESFMWKNNDSAFYYFNKAASVAKDSLTIAMAYNYMAVIQADAGDYFGGQESLTRSLQVLNPKNKKHFSCLAADYNELGLNSLNLKKYQAALDYYDSALRFCEDDALYLMVLNNKALALQKLQQYPQSIAIYEQILKQKSKNSSEYARVLSNISKTKWLQNPGYMAATPLLKALAIRRQENDDWGQNASYAHLADYYSNIQPDSALFYARQMYQVAGKLASPDDRIEALQKLIKLSEPQAAKQYFATYQSLADSLQTARNAAKNQFAEIRYESEKNKADKLKLEEENSAKQHQILLREIILTAAILLFIALVIIAMLWYKKRKQQVATETQGAIRNSQLKTSKKVHDVVANGLYRIMNEIENQDELDKNAIVDKIETLYEKSRDISYEETDLVKENFALQLSELLTSFATPETKILIAGNNPEIWQKVNDKAKYELIHVLQELMVNMKKHSKASHVGLRFEWKDQQININYTDNGRGIGGHLKFNNGLKNTGNRMDDINGRITFDTTPEKGLKIFITFPAA